MEYTTRSPGETVLAGGEIARNMIQRHKSDFVALFGDLGAGKTCLVQGIMDELAPGTPVSSPTYALVNHYCADGLNVYHFDMYRITDPDQLYSTGFYDYLDDGLVITEWSENITYALPDDYLKVCILNPSGRPEERVITAERMYNNNDHSSH